MLGRLPFGIECNICGKEYAETEDLDLHLSRAHPAEPNSPTSHDVYDFDEEVTTVRTETPRRYNWQFFGTADDDDEEECGENEGEDIEMIEEEDLTQDTESPTRRKVALSEEAIADLLHDCIQSPVPCCQERCIRKFDPVKIRACRYDMWERRGSDQGQYILDCFKAADRRGDGQKKIDQFTCQGHSVCYKAWYKLHGISKSRFYMYRNRYMEGQRTAVHRNTGTSHRSTSYWLAHSYLGNFAECYGDKMPDKETINLPSSMTKDTVYEKYKSSLSAQMYKPIQKSTFFTMWREQFPGLKIPKTNRLGICDVCKDLDTALRHATTIDQKASIKKDQALHWEQQMKERQVYWGKARASLDDPTAVLSIIIDGMDQNKTAIPHFAQKTKESEKWKMKTHVTGVIVHGLGLALAYVDNLRWPHDSNLTINILLSTLRKVSMKYDNRLPATLYLQMDNCWRECKNKYVFAFLGFLVLKGVFKEVQVGYLLVGHTHEDVDQFFSRIATELRRRDAITVDELMDAISDSFPNTEVEEVDAMLDVKELLGVVSNDLEQHSCPHAFRFTKGCDGQLVFQYKDFASDGEWKSPRNEEVRLVERLPPANAKPELVVPRLERLELEQFNAGLSTLWQTGKLSDLQKLTLDQYVARQVATADVQRRRKKSIVAGLWPERQLRVWGDGSRPTPVPSFNEVEMERINRLYKNFHKSWKTSEPRLKKKRRC